MSDASTAEQQQGDGQGQSVPEPPASDGTDGAEQVTVSREAWDNVRAAANRKTDAEAIQRENAILKAGIREDAPEFKLLKNYGGDDFDDVLAQYAQGSSQQQQEGEQVGQQQQPQSEGPALQQGEADQTRERQQLSSGAQPEGAGQQEDPYHSMQQTFEQRMGEGATREAAMGQALGDLLASNDPRTVVQGEAAFDESEVR